MTPVRLLAALIAAFVFTTWALADAQQSSPAPVPTPENPITYADACQVDFSSLHPARAHGFLRPAPNGTFVFDDGTRGRFWGINVSNKNLWIPHDEIDRVVETLSRAGTNLVRFEALDSRGALLEIPDQPGTRALNPQRLDTLQYWIAKLEQKHICYYLDLLDFREFKAEDGAEALLNRGARPYAMFDPHLIELQKEYATQLLTARNPYTGLAPVDDPDLVLLEICNEHGFFINPETLTQLVEPYRSRLQAQWNAWLLKRYSSREALLTAWKELSADEDPAAATVALPTLAGETPRGPREMSPRFADGVTFYHEVQRAYFHTMMQHLRGLGLKVPVTAVVSNDIAPDLASVAAECDFLSENFYADHPRFEGKDWEGKFHFRNLNQLRDGGAGAFAPYTSALRWENKPVVIREWATVWPNAYRAVSVPEAVAYARLQDYDGMILFGYKTGEYANRLMFFGYEADPTVWGLYSIGAAIFLRGDIAVAPSRIDFVYTLSTLMSFPNGVTDAHRLAWIMRVNASLRDKLPAPIDTDKPADIVRRMTRPLILTAAASAGTVTQVLGALGYSAPSVQKLLQSGEYTSSTGQITLDTKQGRILIRTPTACIIAGEINGGPINAGALSINSASPIGAVAAYSIDGRPLGSSRRYLVKMVTLADNTGQKFIHLPTAGPPDWVAAEEGGAPVLTSGAPSDQTTTVSLGGRPQVIVGMINGTWELLVDGGDVRFACDTSNVKANILGRKLVTGQR